MLAELNSRAFADLQQPQGRRLSCRDESSLSRMSQRTAASHAASCLLQILKGMNAEVQAVLLISIAELLISESRATLT